uniref:Zinc knuckle CX2CX4HX4C n=1 Tax=Tanacetum cinerariifolium TaxID=118510 RepID=A0A699HL86_TANCI|nr:hypothetical protein [Tanacetum cinerariifolium]
MNTSSGIGVSKESDDTMNEDTPVGVASAMQELILWLVLPLSWGRSSYARAMIELCVNMELNDNIVAAMPKINGEGHYTCNIRVEYEWKPLRRSSCKVFGHNHVKCPKNTGAGETKNVKKTSQASKGVDHTNKVSDSNHFEVLNSVNNDVEMGTNGGVKIG